METMKIARLELPNETSREMIIIIKEDIKTGRREGTFHITYTGYGEVDKTYNGIKELMEDYNNEDIKELENYNGFDFEGLEWA